MAFAVVSLALLGTALYVFQSVRALPGEAARGTRAVVEELLQVAAAFRQGTVETRFVSWATRMEGTTYLQFATLEQTEVFHRRDTSSLLWGQLALPDVVVEATVPVTYTYYVDLDGPWEFTHADRRLRVTAPPIGFNRPAVDASEIRLEPRTTSILRDEESALEALRRSLTTLVERRAREHVPLVRELGRRRIAEFVDRWLAGTFTDGAQYTVEVVFADELPPSSAAPD
ncbi:MAG: hypothetical protein R3244_08330 [Thermoanaerobaculia bacterium]|nr:hypothetical protein [Thermoanaerobaculia bacterium]